MSNVFCGDTTPPNSSRLPLCLQWRGLVKKDKEFYENKARRIAEEQAAKQEAAERAFNDSLNMFPVSQSPMSSNDARMSPASAGGRMTPSGGGQMMTSGQGRVVDRRDTGCDKDCAASVWLDHKCCFSQEEMFALSMYVSA